MELVGRVSSAATVWRAEPALLIAPSNRLPTGGWPRFSEPGDSITLHSQAGGNSRRLPSNQPPKSEDLGHPAKSEDLGHPAATTHGRRTDGLRSIAIGRSGNDVELVGRVSSAATLWRVEPALLNAPSNRRPTGGWPRFSEPGDSIALHSQAGGNSRRLPSNQPPKSEDLGHPAKSEDLGHPAATTHGRRTDGLRSIAIGRSGNDVELVGRVSSAATLWRVEPALLNAPSNRRPTGGWPRFSEPGDSIALHSQAGGNSRRLPSNQPPKSEDLGHPAATAHGRRTDRFRSVAIGRSGNDVELVGRVSSAATLWRVEPALLIAPSNRRPTGGWPRFSEPGDSIALHSQAGGNSRRLPSNQPPKSEDLGHPAIRPPP